MLLYRTNLHPVFNDCLCIIFYQGYELQIRELGIDRTLWALSQKIWVKNPIRYFLYMVIGNFNNNLWIFDNWYCFPILISVGTNVKIKKFEFQFPWVHLCMVKNWRQKLSAQWIVLVGPSGKTVGEVLDHIHRCHFTDGRWWEK